MKTKALQEKISRGKKTFTNKINYNLNKILKTLAKEPRGKTKQRIEYLPKLTKEKGRDENPRTPSFQVVYLPLKWINLANL
jgi:hypothetical protein